MVWGSLQCLVWWLLLLLSGSGFLSLSLSSSLEKPKWGLLLCPGRLKEEMEDHRALLVCLCLSSLLTGRFLCPVCATEEDLCLWQVWVVTDIDIWVSLKSSHFHSDSNSQVLLQVAQLLCGITQSYLGCFVWRYFLQAITFPWGGKWEKIKSLSKNTWYSQTWMEFQEIKKVTSLPEFQRTAGNTLIWASQKERKREKRERERKREKRGKKKEKKITRILLKGKF